MLVIASFFSWIGPTELRGKALSAASPTGVEPSTATSRAVIESTTGQRFLTWSPLSDYADERVMSGSVVPPRAPWRVHRTGRTLRSVEKGGRMSYLQWWKPRLTEAEAVANGARLLTERLGPGWEDRIDLGRLDLCSNKNWVLRQLFGNYGAGSTTLRVGLGRSHGFFGVFRVDALQDAWLDHLIPRVKRDSERADAAIERILASLLGFGELTEEDEEILRDGSGSDLRPAA
jgi:hypothetical protein